MSVFLQWDGAVRMWEHRQTHPLDEDREGENGKTQPLMQEEKKRDC